MEQWKLVIVFVIDKKTIVYISIRIFYFNIFVGSIYDYLFWVESFLNHPVCVNEMYRPFRPLFRM